MKLRWAVPLVAAAVSDRRLRAHRRPPPAETSTPWSIVRDHHFDPAFDLVRWNAVRDELRPKALAAQTPGELRSVLADMLGRLGLSHFAVIPSSPDTPGDRADLSGEPGLDVRWIKQLVVPPRSTHGRGGRCRVTPVDRATDRHDADVGAGRYRRWPSRTAGSARCLAKERFAAWTRPFAGSHHVSRCLQRRGDEDDSPSAEHGDPVTVGNLPTMYVRVSSSGCDPGRKAAGVIGFNVWMTPVKCPFQQAIDKFRSARLVIDLRGIPVVSPQ